MAHEDAYASVLSEQDQRSLHNAEDCNTVLPQISLLLTQCVGMLWPHAESALAAHNIADATRIHTPASHRVASLFTKIARALHTPATLLYERSAQDAPDVQVICMAPPMVVFGPSICTQDLPDLQLRFLLARAAQQVQPERVIACGTTARVWSMTLDALEHAFVSQTSPPKTQWETTLLQALSVDARQKLKALCNDPSFVRRETYYEHCQRAADLAGLLLCGDMDTALRHAKAQDTQGLYQALLNPSYVALRKKLGIAAKD